MFVDDEAMAVKYFKLSFSDTFSILSADSVDTALQVLKDQSSRVAVLVTDQRMPIKQGIDLIKIVKQQYPHIVRMLTTAYSNIDEAIDSVNSGEIYRYIVKPWNLDELRRQLKGAIDLYLENEEQRDLLSEKRQIMFRVASNIAHELRTPLAGIYATSSGIAEALGELIEAYEVAEQHDLPIPDISSKRRQLMVHAFSNIENQVNQAHNMINMLLENIRDESSFRGREISSMAECITEALDSYPSLKRLNYTVEFDPQNDFSFFGNRIAIVNVFHNLLKNALHALQASKHAGGISIGMTSSAEGNCVFFRDTGSGIKKEVLPYIFDDFYSFRNDSHDFDIGNNGIGLAFCKRVLHSWKAEIECQSEAGEYAEFKLTFPPLPTLKDKVHLYGKASLNLK